tara:strand:+ start:90 stop:1055 length:966 start_codon:yes stop_codon:yes gene_type:complete
VIPAEALQVVENIFARDPDPELGYRFRRDYRAIAFGVPLATNSRGFRGPEWSQAPARARRVLLVGDSNAFGYGVPFEDTVGEELARELSARTGTPHEVLNLAVNGYTTRQQLRLLRAEGFALQPERVVVIVTENDHEPPLIVDEAGWLHWIEFSPETRVGDASAARLAPSPGWVWATRHSRLAFWLQLTLARRALTEAHAQRPPLRSGQPGAWMQGAVAPGSISPIVSEGVASPLRELVQECQSRGVQVIVATLAAGPDYRRTVVALEREGVPCLELFGLFPEVGSEEELTAQFGLGWDVHFNAVAHARWARGIADLLEPR